MGDYMQQEAKPVEQPSSVGLSSYLSKMKGNKAQTATIQFSDSLISSFGGLITIFIISVMAVGLGYPVVLGPIGATCLLVFGSHKGPFSQPRHVIGGHLIATALSLTIWDLFGTTHLTIGVTLALVLIVMGFLKVIHPPAAASAIVAINTQVGWGFLGVVIISSVIVVIISVVYNNFFQNREYPQTWL